MYLAEDQKLGMPVAVKVLRDILRQDPGSVRRLISEAKASITLAHPNIIRLHNFEDGETAKFLVMEYVEGETLAHRIAREGRIPEEESRCLSIEICKGLEHAHSKKVIHRDLKPGNVLLGNDGSVRLADFGIARVCRDSVSRLTSQQDSGTLLYMSPEQLDGESREASDIYSFGIMLYEMLSGDPPFTTGEITAQIRYKAPKEIEGLSPLMRRIVMKCLEKKPEDRFASARELCKELAGTTATAAMAAIPVPGAEEAERALMKAGHRQAEDAGESWVNDIVSRARLMFREERIQDARNLLLQALQQHPDHPRLTACLAEARGRMSREQAPGAAPLMNEPGPRPRPVKKIIVLSGAALLIVVIFAYILSQSAGTGAKYSPPPGIPPPVITPPPPAMDLGGAWSYTVAPTNVRGLMQITGANSRLQLSCLAAYSGIALDGLLHSRIVEQYDCEGSLNGRTLTATCSRGSYQADGYSLPPPIPANLTLEVSPDGRHMTGQVQNPLGWGTVSAQKN